jgi:LAO/AO transport system kinase
MWAMVDDRLLTALRCHPQVATLLPEVERDVREGRLTASLAADRLLKGFGLD